MILPIADLCFSKHLDQGARQKKLSVYDAAYLELAMRSQLPLSTMHADWAQAAKQAGVPIFVGTDFSRDDRRMGLGLFLGGWPQSLGHLIYLIHSIEFVFFMIKPSRSIFAIARYRASCVTPISEAIDFKSD